MAIYHFSVKVISRATGRSAVAAAAYRSASRLHDERLDRDHDFTNKSGVVHSEVLLPEIAPALLAVGYILGYRQSAIMVSGSLISAIVLTPIIAVVGMSLPVPLFPETKSLISELSAGQIWSRYVRYIGAGAVAAAGIAAVIKALPTMARRGSAAGTNPANDGMYFVCDILPFSTFCGVPVLPATE